MAKTEVWATANLDPKKILLDVKNPRIEVDENFSQADIRRKLLDLEDVLDLARKIDKSNGLFYGERIITTIEDGKHVVLEGNRRIAACQMLLDPKLIPETYKSRYPSLSAETRTRIKLLSADVAPNRASAEPILTKRHTELGVKPWSPVAKMRRAVRLLDSRSVEEVAQILGTSPSQVKKLIRPYKLLKFAFNLNVWTEDERKVLEDEKLKTNPYTRFFTLSKTQEALLIHFDAEQNIISALAPHVFFAQMERIARDFLLPDPANKGKPRCDTRTNPELYFAELLKSDASKAHTQNTGTNNSQNQNNNADGSTDSNSQNGGTKKPRAIKPSIFFENLECHVQDNNLIKLTHEIININHTKRPIAASLLTRALFECALVYKLKATKKWGALIAENGRDPGLDQIIRFCSQFKNGVFTEANICKTLGSQTTTNAKNYLDAMTHLKYQEADSPTLETIANNLRQLIQYILAGN